MNEVVSHISHLSESKGRNNKIVHHTLPAMSIRGCTSLGAADVTSESPMVEVSIGFQAGGGDRLDKWNATVHRTTTDAWYMLGNKRVRRGGKLDAPAARGRGYRCAPPPQKRSGETESRQLGSGYENVGPISRPMNSALAAQRHSARWALTSDGAAEIRDQPPRSPCRHQGPRMSAAGAQQ